MDVSQLALLIPELIDVRLPSSGLTFGSDRGHHRKTRTQTFGSALPILGCDFDRHALRDLCEVARCVVRRSQGKLRPAGGGDLLDPSLEHQIGIRINSNLRGIPGANMLELRFAIV